MTAVVELPKTIKELNSLLARGFKVLAKSSSPRYGGVIVELFLECPLCGREFNATRVNGRLLHSDCPECGFPNNVLKAMNDLRAGKQVS